MGCNTKSPQRLLIDSKKISLIRNSPLAEYARIHRNVGAPYWPKQKYSRINICTSHLKNINLQSSGLNETQSNLIILLNQKHHFKIKYKLLNELPNVLKHLKSKIQLELYTI